jgi:hypothetical protein
VLAACGALASHSAAAADADLQALREEIAQMKKSYEQRIDALEKRLVDTEKQTVAARSTAETAASQAQAAQATSMASRQPAAANAFNPEISLILSGMYNNTSRDPRQDPTGVAGRERRIQGLLPSGGEFNPEARAWNLGESELAISANIDPHFRGTFLAAISPANEIGVEEANIQTLGLGYGLGVKAGRFFSGIGYANEQHPHMWDFSSAALPYEAFFGPQLGYDGVQFKWVAPTDLFLELGAEFGRARSFPASERNKNGLMSGSIFAHVGGDVGVANSWRAGASFFTSKPRDRTYEDVESTNTLVTNSFSGKSDTTVLDFVWKWAPEGNATERNFKFQSEWFRRHESGRLTYDIDGVGALGGPLTDSFSSTQTGFYAQGVWQFMRGWRVGYRYDQLASADTSVGLVDRGTLAAADLPILRDYSPKRNTAMLDWSPSEFSRIRLQFARDQTRPGVTDDQVWVHYIMSLGAHGAHKF